MTPQKLRAYMAAHSLTSEGVAALIHVSGRSVRYWCNDDDRRDIPYTAWHTLQCKLGECPEALIECAECGYMQDDVEQIRCPSCGAVCRECRYHKQEIAE